MTDTAVQRFYRYHAYVYDSTRWMILHGRRRAVAALGLRPDSRVLEIGCGTGLNFRFVLEHLRPDAGGRLTGLDFSADMLRQAEKRVAAKGWSNVELLQADATTLLLQQKFDGILFAYSLTMIPDFAAAIDRAYEHLKPGAALVVHDFSTFFAWGPLGPVMRGWLRANHVETTRPYLDKLRRVFPDLRVTEWLGGYCFTAVGRKPARPNDDARGEPRAGD